jgi:hypothetical protein
MAEPNAMPPFAKGRLLVPRMKRPEYTEFAKHDLRVVVRTGLRPPTPYSWAIVDEVNGREVYRSPDRFRTLSLAWDDGRSALDHLAGSGKDAKKGA